MTALDVSDLGYSYGAKRALDGVSFTLAPGRFTALLGPNGAGKTTLFSLLTRLFVTREGRITVAGHDIAREPRAALSKIGVVFQQPTLDLDMSVAMNMRYFAALHGISGREARDRSERALAQLGMAERAKERVRDLNGGHRRRMEIARALIHDPEVLLLDEPTVGLDFKSRQAIVDHVHGLAEAGLTVLWATHLVDEIRDEDDVVVLHRGRVLAHDRAARLHAGRPLADVFIEMTGGAEVAA
ncbi:MULTISPECIES: ABC transporter ATP-binding protein [Salipiger]|uniref:ABC-2 type transport system ATP-binding protein n=1 Tax=Salipiger profundus TaxID=1229727 RepID=A0A1U7D301_9RHOB|nr:MULTISPECIES: ABC transporter ATP-binding protein [Salipiger]APX22544.1 ABC-2 type transport system ATP-binding protein [Salipiger profundus]GGA11384.1 ABC transporter ATP-binding protein [Salipiger profundus]SFC69490.1 ABC-2 type transport system ATP-binding protein [Salipiger profundus]